MKGASVLKLGLGAAAVAMVLAGAGLARGEGDGKGESVAVSTTGFVFKSVPIPGAPGAEMEYVVYVPREYSADRGAAWPAIMFLHGRGESGTDGQKMIAQGIGTNILWNASRWPAIVVMPQKPDADQQWETYDAAVMSILEQVRKEYRVDPDRIALTGLSQGGHGTWMLGAMHPQTWCALAPICGYADSNGGSSTPQWIAERVKDLPIWTFHGDADDVVLPGQTEAIVAALKSAGAKSVKMTLYPGVNHGSWDRAYAEKELPGFLMKGK